jgi:hypothetical protein
MTSEITSHDLQIDGRSYIRERHVDDAGQEHLVEYLADADADVDAILVLHAQGIVDQLAADQGGL